MRRVHITFGDSAAGSLMMALETAGLRAEPVWHTADDFGYGPIDQLPSEHRSAWMREHLGYDLEPDNLWRKLAVRDVDTQFVAWFSSRSVSEYCGYLEVLSRVPTLHEMDVATLERQAFGRVRPEDIVPLLDRAVPVSTVERTRLVADWQRIRAENGDLRMLTSQGLVSATFDALDTAILAHVTHEWRRCAYVIGSLLDDQHRQSFEQFSSDLLLFERLTRLVDQGVLEGSDAAEWSFRESRVRRRYQ